MSSESRHVCYRINILGSELSPSSINLVPVQAGKVTVGQESHWPRVTDISGSPPDLVYYIVIFVVLSGDT